MRIFITYFNFSLTSCKQDPVQDVKPCAIEDTVTIQRENATNRCECTKAKFDPTKCCDIFK